MEPISPEKIFRHRMPVQIRFSDVDRYGHVNNNAYFSFYDLGKADYFSAVLRLYDGQPEVVPVVANIKADFLLPVFYGDDIVMETRVSRLGQKSFTLQQRAVNAKTNTVVCQCETVMVCFSLADQASVPLPEHFREAITHYESL